ncbi:UNVERIFIED_CONTAM: protein DETOXIFICATION 24 [Sesamum calycinum]|uniref:Protein DETOXIFICATION 24 n=1 Tax=Sesamum calycinum TaxID=2727403 RepID=A0AAW2RTD9_9LAMI
MDNSIQDSLLSTASEEKSDLKGRIWEESKKIWRVALPGYFKGDFIWKDRRDPVIRWTYKFSGSCGIRLVQTISERFVEGIVARKTTSLNLQDVSLWFILFVYSIAFSITIQMYLQAQQKNMVIAWLSVMQFAVHIPLSWLFVYVLNWGTNGAMAALSISSWLLVCGEFVYIFGGWCADSWKGFSFAAFKDIFPVVKLSISSGLMVCLELWYYAILVLLAGYMKDEASISAFSICVRVANELGRGDAKATKFSIKVLMGTSVVIGLLFWILTLVFGKKLGYLFTNEEGVARTVLDLSRLLAFSVLLNSIYPVLSGVVVGAGLQTKAAIINLVCFYIIGLPIGAVLGYVFQLQVKGIWIGMISGVVTETLALSFMIWRTNWDEEVSITSTRLKQWYLESLKENTTSSPHS